MSKNQNVSDFDIWKTTIKCTGLMKIGFWGAARTVYSCFDDEWIIKAPSRSTIIISFLQMFGHRTWCSFFSAAFAICFPVMSCRLAFHQYRFPYSMKATHLASLHAMFPSCFDFATLTIAGPSFVGGGCYCWTLLLNVRSLIAIAKNGKELSHSELRSNLTGTMIREPQFERKPNSSTPPGTLWTLL